MDNVKINTSKTLTLTLPSDPTSNVVTVNVNHDFGDSVVSNVAATRSSPGIYTITLGQQNSGIYTLNSAGIHDVQFTYAMSGQTYTQSQYINVYTPYLDLDTFFDGHPELIDTFEDVFDSYELKVRNIINTYCGQTFEYFPDKSFTFILSFSIYCALPFQLFSSKIAYLKFKINLITLICLLN
jgi:hypothetical protein